MTRLVIFFTLITIQTTRAERPAWVGVMSWAVPPPLSAENRTQIINSATRETILISKNPEDAAALSRLGMLQFQLRQFEYAALSFRRLLKLQPEHPFALTQYMQALYLTGDADTVRWLMKQNVITAALPLPSEMLAAQLDFDAKDFAKSKAHLEIAWSNLQENQVELDERRYRGLAEVVLNNLIYCCRKINDIEGAQRYRIMLAKIYEPILLEGIE